MEKITIDGKRYDLSTMIDLKCGTRESHGVWRERTMWGPKSHRLIIEDYSIWQSRSGDGTVEGSRYRVVDPIDPDWADEMQRAIEGGDLSDDTLRAMQAAMDEHCPCVES